MFDRNVITVLCNSVSKFGNIDKNVICVKRGIVGNVLGCFILYVLTKLYSVV